MTGEEVLALAASHGVRVTFALGDLHLEADHEPPAEALVALRDHKEAVVAVLSKTAELAGEWRLRFEDHVGTVMRARGLPRPEGERAAFDIVLVERLNDTHPDTPSDRCAWCGKSETPDATLLPIGVGLRHAWLHRDCWEPWRTDRRAKATAELAEAGVVV